jgi:hypothetical protein
MHEAEAAQAHINSTSQQSARSGTYQHQPENKANEKDIPLTQYEHSAPFACIPAHA